MRHGTNRRQRGRGNSGNRGNQQRMQVFDSNGPDVRIRGTAHQVTEKYMGLAKDAASSGDKVLAESYLQHAEHYQRVINSWLEDEVPTPSQKSGNRKPVKQSKDSADGDLALPASILGAEANVKSEEAAAEATA